MTGTGATLLRRTGVRRLTSRSRLLWLGSLALALAVTLVPLLTGQGRPRLLGPEAAFWLALALATACVAVSVVGLYIAHRDDLAEFGVMCVFFLALSLLPLVHGLKGSADRFAVDGTTIAAAFWALPIALAVALPLLAIHSSGARWLLVRWRHWVGGWMVAVGALCWLAVTAPGWLRAPAAGSAPAVARGLVCFALCVVLSLRYLRLAELSATTRCLLLSLSFLLLAGSSLRWLSPQPFNLDFWIETGSSVVAVQVGVLVTIVLFAGHANLRQIVRPITAWDPVESFEVGLDPVVHALVADLERKDPATRAHVVRTSALAIELAQHLRLPAPDVRQVALAALLHDVGKLDVPDEILTKPGPLTDDEWVVMRRHPVDGARIVERSHTVERAAPAVRTHHERWDGAGYPDGLGGEAIPFVGRIVAVCDAVDAMAFTRHYRAGRQLTEITDVLRSGAGGQWDPAVVAAMVDLLDGRDSLPDAHMFDGIEVGEDHELSFCVPDDPRPVGADA